MLSSRHKPCEVFPLYKELVSALGQAQLGTQSTGASIVGVDYSESMLASAKERAAALNLRKIKLIRADVSALPFESESFDVVLSIDVLGSLCLSC